MALSPPYFDNKNKVDLQSLQRIVESMPLIDERSSELLSAMVMMGSEEGELASLEQLSPTLKIKVPAIRNRLKGLVLLGVVESTDVPSPTRRRPAAVFRPAIPTLANLTSPPPSKAQLPALPDNHEVHVMSENIARALSGVDGNYFIDNLFCSILFTALPHSRRLHKEPKSVVVSWFKYKVPVVLRPFHGGAICKGEDVRFYVGLITYLTELVKREGVPLSVMENGSWTVPLSEILKCLGMKREGGNQETALAAFERFAGTRFELFNLPDEIMSRHHFEEAKQYFQPLSNYGVYEEVIDKYRRRLITFTLPPTVQSAILSLGDSFFRLSPNALHYAEPYFLRIHLWAKRRLGSRNSHVEVPQERAWQEINPGTGFKSHLQLLEETILNFANYYHELLKDGQISTGQFKKLVMAAPVLDNVDGKPVLLRARVNLFGYIIRYSKTHLYIDRDPTDPISGIQLRSTSKFLGPAPEQGDLLS